MKTFQQFNEGVDATFHVTDEMCELIDKMNSEGATVEAVANKLKSTFNITGMGGEIERPINGDEAGEAIAAWINKKCGAANKS